MNTHLVVRITAIGSMLLLLSAPVMAAGAEPAPPYPPPPASAPPPHVSRRPPPPPPYPTVAPPPPLSPVMRVLYAPFYAAGLVVRYGVYYTIVAPIEVFSRTLNYGVNGGVGVGSTHEREREGREGDPS